MKGKFAGIFLYRDRDTGKPSSVGIEFRTDNGKYVKLYLPYSNKEVASSKLDRAAKALEGQRKAGLPLLQDLCVVLATSQVLRKDPNTVFELECDTLRNGDLAVKNFRVASADDIGQEINVDDIF